MKFWNTLIAPALVSAVALGSSAVRADEMVQANHMLVIAGHPEATRLGMQVLENGGNAIDALVTVSLSLNVAEPGNSGLGGKMVFLYYDATTHKTVSVVALDAAPLSLDVAKVIALPAAERQRGWVMACTPGLAAALGQAHAKWGVKRWKEDVEPAVKLASNGVKLNTRAAEMLTQFPPGVDATATAIYAPTGKPLGEGQILKNAALAHTLQLIADGGYRAFYHGEIADHLVAAAKAGGGYITQADLDAYQPRFLEPLHGTYHGYSIDTSPPPLAGGATLLAALDCLAGTDWAGIHPRDARYIDTVCRVLEQIYPQVQTAAADFPGSLQRVDEMLSPENIRALTLRARASDPRKPELKRLAENATLDDSDQASTTHLIIIDAKGDIVCCTQSLGIHFGSAVVAPGDGFLLNADIDNFVLATPTSKNFIAPGKWPRSTMTPTIVFKDDQPFLAIGSPAGQRIPVQVLQVSLDVLDFLRPLEEAIRAPRFHLRHADPAANDLDIEAQSDASLDAELTKMGWQTHRRDDSDFYFGSVNAALIDGNHVIGVADQRRTSDVGGE
jgi:gamma-glutamyltranspeptidase / glutathione hydrolase